jgi:crotonobetainyl-CoA:carnitine CoA-transferase CaiB-like acyl-CoA transferase
MRGRAERRAEVEPVVEGWTGRRTVAEVVELASAFRIPAAPVLAGADCPELACYREGGTFAVAPGSTVVEPRSALRFAPPADVGATAGPGPGRTAQPAEAGGADPEGKRPLDDIRVADFTAFWAGPYATDLLALLGADVIHVESPGRPDGMRARSTRGPDDPQWLEWSGIFHLANGSKRGIAIDLDDPAGRDLARRLIERSDAVVENFSPRVMDAFGFDGAGVAAARPDAIMVRMPAYGLDNPWRDRPGFQMTVEMLSGIAWITGDPAGVPCVTYTCDALEGVHAAFALLCALHRRDRGGGGGLVEVRLAEVAAALAAEQVVTASAHGRRLDRIGNRHRSGDPQGVYRCRDGSGGEAWVAVSAVGDGRWQALAGVAGMPAGLRDPQLQRAEQRVLRGPAIEETLAAWCAERDADDIVAALWGAGVPVARLDNSVTVAENPQLAARGFFQEVVHPVCGVVRYPGLPMRAEPIGSGGAVPTAHRSAAPCVGQHDAEVLGRVLGLGDGDIDALRQSGTIGDRSGGLRPM